jgi:uncharacterized membrane protein YccC
MTESRSPFEYIHTVFFKAHSRALKNSFTIDLSLLSPIAGAITALPVALVFAIGLAFGTDTGAIAMAVGANLIAIASLVGAPRLSLRIALLDALLLSVAVFIGTLSDAHSWLHFVLLIPWCFGAGMLEVFGQTSAIVGSQAVIAYIVLGRFSGSTVFAFHFALLVALGAVVEVLALVVLRLPSSLRYQRSRLALCFDALGRLALQDPLGSATTTLALLDDTERLLDAPALFGRSDVRELRATFDQAKRLRLEITTLAGLRVRLNASSDKRNSQDVENTIAGLGAALSNLADDLRHRPKKTRFQDVQNFESIVTSLDSALHDDASTDVLAAQCADHLRAIAGQLRAAQKLVVNLGANSGKRIWRPTLPEFSRPDVTRLRTDALVLKDNLNLDSSAFRHAVRLAIAVPAASLIGSALSLPRSFWMTFAVVTILKPDYNTLLDKGVGRMIGTMIGATVASLIVAGLHPNLTLTVVLVALAAWVAYSTWFSSFAVSFGFVTALVLLLLSITTTDTISTALDRLIDFSLGGVIALIAYLVWPTPPQSDVRDALSSLYETIGSYLIVVFKVVEGEPIKTDQVIARSRALRKTWSRAEGAIGRAINVPGSVTQEPDNAKGQLAATMRILRALHAIRIEAERGAKVNTSEELDTFIDGCVVTLAMIGDHLDHRTERAQPNLRALLRAVDASSEAPRAPVSLSANLDELVNALDTAVGLVQLS